MAHLTPDMLKKLKEAAPTGGGVYIRPGNYIFIIDKMFIKQGFKGTSFVIELYVAEAAQAADSDKKPNPVGSKCSFSGNLGNNTSAPGNLKQFVLALLDAEDDDSYASTLESLLDEKVQPARGLMIADSTFEGVIQSGPNAGKSITKHKWSYVDTSVEQKAANTKLLSTLARPAAPPATGAPAMPAA